MNYLFLWFYSYKDFFYHLNVSHLLCTYIFLLPSFWFCFFNPMWIFRISKVVLLGFSKLKSILLWDFDHLYCYCVFIPYPCLWFLIHTLLLGSLRVNISAASLAAALAWARISSGLRLSGIASNLPNLEFTEFQRYMYNTKIYNFTLYMQLHVLSLNVIRSIYRT